MRKRILLFALVAALVASSFAISALANTEPTPWNGTDIDTDWYSDETADSFEIGTAAELAGLAQLVNNGNSFSGKTIVLTASINLDNKPWTPIGTSGNPFKGNFDGQNNTISNLFIAQATNNAGLFGLVGVRLESNCNPVIENVSIVNARIDCTSGNNTGALAGTTYGTTLSNCHVSGSISIICPHTSASYNQLVGGLVGQGYTGTITDCSVIGDIEIKGGVCVGGINGYGYASAYNCVVKDTSGEKGLVFSFSQVGGINGWCGEGSIEISGCTVENMLLETTDECSGAMTSTTQYGNIISNNTVTNVDIKQSYNNAATIGYVAGRNLGNASDGATFVINNVVTNVTATNVDTLVTQTAGTCGYTVVGTDVVLDSERKVVSGSFEQLNTSLLNTNSEATQCEDGTWTVKHYVAAIGTTRYESLQEAIDAAAVDQTVKLLADITVEETKQSGYTFLVGPNADIILDLGAYTISGTVNAKANYSLINVQGKLKLTGSGGTITLTNTDNSTSYGFFSAVIGLQNHDGYTVDTALIVEDGVTIEHKGGTVMAYGIDMVTYTGCSVTINGGTVESSYIGIRIFGNNGNKTLTVNGGTVRAANCGLWAQHNGSADVDLAVTGGSVHGDRRGIYLSTESSSAATLDVSLTGGTITGTTPLSLSENANASTAPVITKDSSVTVPAPASYCWNADGKLTNAVAEVNGTYCATLQEAIDAATEGQTVTLLEDIELTATFTIPESKTLTLDLAGKAITVTKSGDRSLYAFNNRGVLTLTDSVGTGSITARGNYNYGTLVMDSGSIIACDTNGGYGIWNYGSFTMNGGLLKATHVGSYGDQYGPTCLGNMNGASALITGGTIESASMRAYAISSEGTLEITPAEGKTVTVTGQRAVAIDAGTAVINGGTFTALKTPEGLYAPETYYALYIADDAQSVTVNSGTFNAPDSSVQIGTKGSSNMTGSVTINGGTFNAPLNGQDTDTNQIPADVLTVTGGSFASDPSEFLVVGKAITVADGVYTVSLYSAVVVPDDAEKVEVFTPSTDADTSNDLKDVFDKVNNATNNNVTLTVPMKEGTVALDKNAVNTIATSNSAGAAIQLSIVKKSGSENAYTITLTQGGQPISQLGGNATVTLPAPAGVEAPIVQYYDEATQKWIDVASTVVNGQIVFVTDHFSDWRIVEGPHFSKVNVSMSGILGVNFKVDKGSAENLDAYTVYVTIGNDPAKLLTGVLDEETGLYVFTADLMAHRMGETLTVKLMHGEQLVDEYTFTIAAYVSAANALSTVPQEMKDLLNAMLVYGEYAANYKTPCTTSSMTEISSTDLQKFAPVISEFYDDNVKFSVVFDEAFDLKMKFPLSYADHTLTVGNFSGLISSLEQEGEYYVYRVDQILAQNLDKVYRFVVTSESATVYDVQVSAMSYIMRCLTDGGTEPSAHTDPIYMLMKSAYYYYTAAEAYLGNQE